MILHNPTGLGIRSDPGGDGHFGASRGNRKHEGLDFLCAPGQIVRAVIPGKLVSAYPYAGDVIFAGCRLWGKDFMAKMFYFIPHKHLINEDVLAGEEIGIAQDISAKYGGGMLPHLHVGLYKLNPTLLVNPEDYLDADKEQLRNGGY
jgi:murein DD-endopeptidase MepM/ murein hydrolase activator NlpD